MPAYESKFVETKDIITFSLEEMFAVVTGKSDEEAEVSTSANKLLKYFSKSE